MLTNGKTEKRLSPKICRAKIYIVLSIRYRKNLQEAIVFAKQHTEKAEKTSELLYIDGNISSMPKIRHGKRKNQIVALTLRW